MQYPGFVKISTRHILNPFRYSPLIECSKIKTRGYLDDLKLRAIVEDIFDKDFLLNTIAINNDKPNLFKDTDIKMIPKIPLLMILSLLGAVGQNRFCAYKQGINMYHPDIYRVSFKTLREFFAFCDIDRPLGNQNWDDYSMFVDISNHLIFELETGSYAPVYSIGGTPSELVCTLNVDFVLQHYDTGIKTQKIHLKNLKTLKSIQLFHLLNILKQFKSAITSHNGLVRDIYLLTKRIGMPYYPLFRARYLLKRMVDSLQKQNLIDEKIHVSFYHDNTVFKA